MIVEWNKLNKEKRNFESISFFFKKRPFELTRHSPNTIFGINNPCGIKLSTRLRLGLSHLNEHQSKYGVDDTVNSICTCDSNIELISHLFFYFKNSLKEGKLPLTTFFPFFNLFSILLSKVFCDFVTFTYLYPRCV